jgi:hypothetical protein
LKRRKIDETSNTIFPAGSGHTRRFLERQGAGIEYAKIEILTEKIAPNLYILSGSAGADPHPPGGIFMIDARYAQITCRRGNLLFYLPIAVTITQRSPQPVPAVVSGLTTGA